MYFRVCISVCVCKGLCGEAQRDTRIYLIPLSLLVIYCELFVIHNIQYSSIFCSCICLYSCTYICMHVCVSVSEW